jgi:hypothetical protein
VDSVLARATRADVLHEPFPHVIVEDALESSLVDQLIEEFPVDAITGGRSHPSNRRLNLRAATSIEDPRLSPLWREIVATHVSQRYLDQLLELFGDAVRETYPRFERRYGKLEKLQAGIRDRDTFESADVLLEAQAAVNTPVTGPASSVRRGHLDYPNKLFVGLYYLRHPDDYSTGGDLELYRYPAGAGRPVFEGHEIDDPYIEVVKTVPYRRNTLIVFMNSRESLHGVTVRQQTDATRLFLNLSAEVRRDLFAIPGERVSKRVVSRARAAVPASVRRQRARIPTLAVAMLLLLALLFVLMPEALGDRPYDVF